MFETANYLLLQTQSAPKASARAAGNIRYAVLRDVAGTEVYFCLLANEGGGYFSQEAVAFSAIEACLSDKPADQSLPAKTFKSAFQGRSANNAGFLVAVLRHEGLLQAAPDASHQHVRAGDWAAWRQTHLTATGEPFELPEVTKAKAKEAATMSTRNEIPPADAATGKKPRKAVSGKRTLPTATDGDDASPV